jgi:mRNA interferase RelE/StbE
VGYRIDWAASAARDFRALTRRDRRAADRVAAAVRRLADDPRPRGSVALAGQDEGYRIRIGAYRVLYQVEDSLLVVLVMRVGDRSDVYRRNRR